MSSVPLVDLTVYPDDCDAYGHLNQAAFLRLFERARWDAVATGPGMDVFTRNGVWPALRKGTVEFYMGVYPGDVLRFETHLTQLGHTSFSLHQSARRLPSCKLVAEGEFVFVCINEAERPTGVPGEVATFFGTRPSVRSGFTQHLSVRGISTAVDIQGDGPAILFVHGFPMDRTLWRHQLAAIRGWRRIAPDLRGMGLTEVSDRYSMAEYADDMDSLMDVLGASQAVVCGLSMGGYIAFEILRRHRKRVRALILSNTRAGADTVEGRANRDAMIDTVRVDGPAAVAETLIPKLLGPSSLEAMPKVVGHLRTMICNTPARGVIGALEAMRDRSDSTEFCKKIDVPTLVIAGANDRIVSPAEAGEMADLIPGAQFVIIPEAGHLAPIEQPIACNRVIGEFVESLR